MAKPVHKTLGSALALALLMLFLAAAAIYQDALLLWNGLGSGPSFGDPLTTTAGGLRTLSLVAVLAAIVVALIAVAIIQRERRLRLRTENRFDRLLHTADQAGELITMVNRKGMIEYLNSAVEQATGYSRHELIGRSSRPWLPWYGDDASFDDACRTVLAGGSFRGLIGCRRKDGTPFLLEDRIAPLIEKNGTVQRFVSIARDVTRQKEMEDRLVYLDKHDHVTGMPNRRYFSEILRREIEDCARSGSLLAVLVLDVDRFKYINDLFGTDVGDDILRQIAKIIRATLGEQDNLARLGSDEFGIIHRYDMQHLTAGIIADRIQRALSRKMLAGGHEIVLTGTLGISTFPDDGQDAATLHASADMALSRAKASGRNSVQFYSKEIKDRAFEFFVIEKRLSEALQKNEFRIVYQPYCDLSSQKIVGAEALIRWNNEEIGVVSPSRFIPSLEESGQIIDVGAWVLKTACRQLQEWKRNKLACPVAVNLSHVQFTHKNLVPMVAGIIRELNIDPRMLTLELTESICIKDMDFTISVLTQLKDIGISLSVDDFGTGYSSLSYIKKLPVDNLKIDMSFIRDVSRDPDAASIITAITGMAKSLNLRTIAEGVETEGQRNILHLLRCDLGQGFLFSPAIEPDALAALFANRSSIHPA